MPRCIGSTIWQIAEAGVDQRDCLSPGLVSVMNKNLNGSHKCHSSNQVYIYVKRLYRHRFMIVSA